MKKINLLLIFFTTLILGCDQQYPDLDNGLYANIETNKGEIILAYGPLSRLKRTTDPRRVNGGVFLGLNGTVVKSHGAADATGVAAAVGLAYRLGSAKFSTKLAARVASVNGFAEDHEEDGN